MFGIVMNQHYEKMLLKGTASALVFVASFMTMPSYAHNDADRLPAQFSAEAVPNGTAQVDTRRFPDASDARVNWTRDGTGVPENLNRIAAIPRSQEQSVSGCSK